MISFRSSSILLLGLAYTARSEIDSIHFQSENEVFLLQASAEIKKGKSSTAADHKAPIAEAEYKVSCPAVPLDVEKADRLQITLEHPQVLLEESSRPEQSPSTEFSHPMQTPSMKLSRPEQMPSTESSFEFVAALRVCLLLFGFLFAAGLQRLFQESTPSKATCRPTAETSSSQEGWTELLQAASVGDSAGFEAAVAQCSSLNKLDNWGCTALHYAAKGGSSEIVRRLLDHGLQVNATEAWDETALHIAARAGHKDACDVLINEGAIVDALNAQDWTPLVVAGHARQQDVCRLLLSHGAGVGGVDDSELPSMISLMIAQQVLLKAAGVDDQ